MLLPRWFSRAVAAVLLVLAGGCGKPAATDARLAAPTALADAATEAGAQHVFFNPQARKFLIAAGRDLAPATPGEFSAVENPALWRRLDRQTRFDAVVLAGQPSDYAALLRHLRGSPDFRLARLDNWGVLFLRGQPEAYTPPSAGDAVADLADPGDRAEYLAQMAVVLDAAGEPDAAADYLERAAGLAPEKSTIRTRAAYIDLQHHRFREAVEKAGQALEIDPKNLPALQIKAQALAASGDIDKAWLAAEEMKSIADPADMNALFLHAQIASAAHAYSREQDSLERLIDLAGKAGIPAASYHVYLGQCHAKQGKPRPAIENLEAALAGPHLTDTQRADVETALKTIVARSGIAAPAAP